MSITTLPTPPNSRRFGTGWVDATNRFYLYNPIFNNGSPFGDYDLTHTGALDRYDPASGTWTTLAFSNFRTQVGEPSLYVSSTKKWTRVCGQILSATNDYTQTVETYDETTNTWTTGPDFPKSTPTSTGRVDVAGFVSTAGVLYAGGGYDNRNGINTFDLYMLSGGSWVARASAPQTFETPGAGPNPMDSFGRAYFFVDTQASNGTGFGPMRYDPVANSWFSGTNPPHNFNPDTPIMAPGDVLYVNGVIPPNRFFMRYDTNANTWTTLSAQPVVGTGFMVYKAGFIYLIGPTVYPPTGTVFADPHIYAYDIAHNTWIATRDSITPRFLPTTPFADALGGFYLPVGSDINSQAVNVVEYLVPDPAPGPPCWDQASTVTFSNTTYVSNSHLVLPVVASHSLTSGFTGAVVSVETIPSNVVNVSLSLSVQAPAPNALVTIGIIFYNAANTNVGGMSAQTRTSTTGLVTSTLVAIPPTAVYWEFAYESNQVGTITATFEVSFNCSGLSTSTPVGRSQVMIVG